MLSAKQAAVQTGVSVSMVYRWCKEGTLEHFRVGASGKRGKVLIDPSALKTFLERCKQEPSEPVGLRHIRMR